MATIFNDGRVAKPNNPVFQQGKTYRTVNAKVSFDGDQANGDIVVLAESLTVDTRVARVLSVEPTPALAGMTSVQLGFYRKDTNGTLTAVDADALWDAQSFAAAKAQGDLLRLNTTLDRSSTIGDILGTAVDASFANGLVLALTLIAAGSATGTLDLDIQLECATSN